MIVLCFDRDYTISVNPKPSKKSVSLSWVKYYSHEAEGIDVWAIGNQHLKTEASIPGIEEARQLWEQYNNRDARERYEDNSDYHNYKPVRREGLRLIQDVYQAYLDEDIEFVVVDDVNLRDMEKEGWTHYLPWDFVEAVKSGNGPVDCPEDNPYTGTSVESKACKEDIKPHHSL